MLCVILLSLLCFSGGKKEIECLDDNKTISRLFKEFISTPNCKSARNFFELNGIDCDFEFDRIPHGLLAGIHLPSEKTLRDVCCASCKQKKEL